MHIFGDASEPGARQTYRATVAAVPRLPDGTLRTFQQEIPKAIIEALPRREKKIYFYELLWPLLAVFVRRDLLANAYSIFHEDNTAAQNNLLNGVSNSFAPSLFLALFWGASAAQTSHPWIARVVSDDNPADCLTKPGLPAGHLDEAIKENPSQFDKLWNLLLKHLT